MTIEITKKGFCYVIKSDQINRNASYPEEQDNICRLTDDYFEGDLQNKIGQFFLIQYDLTMVTLCRVRSLRSLKALRKPAEK